MHPITKIIIGVFLVAASIYYIIKGIPGYLSPALPALIIVLKGIIPLLVIIFGTFIIWLELDELRFELELKKEKKKKKKIK